MVSSNPYSVIARMLTYRPITDLLSFMDDRLLTRATAKYVYCCRVIGPNVTCSLQQLQLMHTDCGEVHALLTRSRFTISRDRAGMQIPRNLYPGRADVTQDARMLCMQPSGTLSGLDPDSANLALSFASWPD
jgi:hypothetical protein